MDLTRRELLSTTLVAGGALTLAACAPQDRGAETKTPASLAPGSGYGKSGDEDRPVYTAKGHELLASLKSFETICQPRQTQGRIEKLAYSTHSYVWEEAHPGTETIVDKSLYVWLPADYDASRTYDVLYLMHGTGHEGVDYWLTDELDCHGTQTRGLLDGMVEDGLIKDVIVVTPSYYSFPPGEEPTDPMAYHQGDEHADDWPRLFWHELRESIVPLVDSTYPTNASREHRAFAGLSRGSMTSVNSVMMHCLDLFGWIGSFSGIWADFDEFKSTLEGEYAGLPVYYWYNGNGSKDFSLENHGEFRDNVLGQMSNRFADGQNYAWICFPGGTHDYNCWAVDLYNSLLAFF